MVVFGNRPPDGLEHPRLDFAELPVEERTGGGPVSSAAKLPC